MGCQRSGTTLLRLLLTSHENIGIPPEGPYIVRLKDRYTAQTDFSAATARDFAGAFLGVSKCAEWGLDEDEIIEALEARDPANFAEAISTVHRLYLARHFPGATRWGDKNPSYVKHVDYLLQLFPNARCIFITRDGRDVALSWMNTPFGTRADIGRRRPLEGNHGVPGPMARSVLQKLHRGPIRGSPRRLSRGVGARV